MWTAHPFRKSPVAGDRRWRGHGSGNLSSFLQKKGQMELEPSVADKKRQKREINRSESLPDSQAVPFEWSIYCMCSVKMAVLMKGEDAQQHVYTYAGSHRINHPPNPKKNHFFFEPPPNGSTVPISVLISLSIPRLALGLVPPNEDASVKGRALSRLPRFRRVGVVQLEGQMTGQWALLRHELPRGGIRRAGLG